MQYSIVNRKDIDSIVARLDAEYYHPYYIELEKKIKNYGATTIKESKGKLDCSAFYPSITPYYNFEKIGIPFLRVNELQNGLVEFSCDSVFLPDFILEDNPSTIAIAKYGDIIIAKGGNTLAKVAIIPNSYSEYSVCRDLIIIKTDKLKNINKFYLWAYLLSKSGKDLMLRTASQTGQPHLTLEAINNLDIPIIDNNFQDNFEKIYHKLYESKQNSQISYHKAEELILEELGLNNWQPKHKLSFIKNFSDIQNAERIDAEYFQPKYDEIIQAIKNYKGGWDKLSNIVSIKKCVEVGSDAYTEEGISFVRVSNLNKFEINENNQQCISQELYEELAENFQPKKGEILLSKDGTAGLAYHVNSEAKKMIPCGGILRLKVKNKDYLPEYLTLVLNSLIVQEQIEKVLSGALIKHWLTEQINNTVIPKLDVDKQKEIVEKIQESFKCREQSKQLLEIAKQGVEKAIEENEESATAWINQELEKLGIN